MGRKSSVYTNGAVLSRTFVALCIVAAVCGIAVPIAATSARAQVQATPPPPCTLQEITELNIDANGLALNGDGTRAIITDQSNAILFFDYNVTNSTISNVDASAARLDLTADAQHTCLLVNGALQVFLRQGGAWVEKGTALGAATSCSLSNNGARVAVGDSQWDSGRGRVQIFEFVDNVWMQVGSAIEGAAFSSRESARAMTLSGDGTLLFTSSLDHMAVYALMQGVWTLQGSTFGMRSGTQLATRQDAMSKDATYYAEHRPDRIVFYDANRQIDGLVVGGFDFDAKMSLVGSRLIMGGLTQTYFIERSPFNGYWNIVQTLSVASTSVAQSTENGGYRCARSDGSTFRAYQCCWNELPQ